MVCAESETGKLAAAAASTTINLRNIATLLVPAATLPRRKAHPRRIVHQEVRISAQRKVRIRAYTIAMEKITTEPHLTHFTQAYRARPNDSAPTLTNKRTASAWRICIRRSSDNASTWDVRPVLYSSDQ